MREHLGFLKMSSAVVKVAAWVFLFLGVVSGISTFLKAELPYPRYVVLIGSAMYVFLFFLLFLIAKIADLLIKIINEIRKE